MRSPRGMAPRAGHRDGALRSRRRNSGLGDDSWSEDAGGEAMGAGVR
jgi:hypothetical protein